MTSPRFSIIAVAGLSVGLGACAALNSPADRATEVRTTQSSQPGAVAPSSMAKPKLVVVIVVDQMRADYLATQRDGDPKRALRHFYWSGFDVLLTEGAVFTNAKHWHALTQTAPGHAVISTGLFPCHHGVVSNEWLEPPHWNTPVTAVIDAGPGQLRAGTIGDTLKKQVPMSKVASVAQKDRAALLMGGKEANIVIWFDPDSGAWITHPRYPDASPAWLKQLNDDLRIDQYLNLRWYRQMGRAPESYTQVARKDDFEKEAANEHVYAKRTFPHVLSSYDLIGRSPIGDLMTLEAAKSVIDELKLGDDEATDLLWIGFSAPDHIGHLFGPFSQEMMDEYLRLDQVIGQLIRHLDKGIGRDRYLLVLTADHGAPPVPEYADAELSGDWKRVLAEEYESEVKKQFKPQGGNADVLWFHEDAGFYIDKAQRDERALRDVENALAKSIESDPRVANAFTRTELSTCLESTDTTERAAYSRSYYAGRSANVLVQFRENYMLSAYPTGSSHGSPYDYDTRVPLIVFGNGTMSRQDGDAAGPVDIAPTIAELLGLKASELDGKSLLDRTRPHSGNGTGH